MSLCQEAKPLVPTDMGQGSAWPWMEPRKFGAGFEPPLAVVGEGPGGVLPANPAGWLGLSKQGQPCSPTHQRACASEGTSVEQPSLADVVRVPTALPTAWPSCHMAAGAEGTAAQAGGTPAPSWDRGSPGSQTAHSKMQSPRPCPGLPATSVCSFSNLNWGHCWPCFFQGPSQPASVSLARASGSRVMTPC